MLRPRTKVFKNLESAEQAVLEISEGESCGWTYKAASDPRGSGSAIIKVYDEEDVFVSNFFGQI